MGLPRGAVDESSRLAGVGFRVRPWSDVARTRLVQRLLSTAIKRSACVSPIFRVMSAADYVANLRSDRSHMRDANGNYHKPPPPWSPPGGGSDTNLAQFIDLNQPVPGEIYDLAGFLAICGKIHLDDAKKRN